MEEYVLGMDMGGTNLRTCVGTMDGNPIAIQKIELDFSSEDIYYNQIRTGIDATLKAANLRASDIIRIGIGAAGQPDEKEGIIYNPANCPFPLLDFPKRLREEPCFELESKIRNDVAVAVFAAKKQGYGKDLPDQNPRYDAAMTIGTGTNIAIMVNGILLESPTNETPEWGHIKLNTDSNYIPKCGCGARGCIESYIAGAGIKTRAIDALVHEFDSKKPGEILKQQILRETIKRIGTTNLVDPFSLINQVKAEDVLEAYTHSTDDLSKRLVDDTTTYMAYAFGTVLSSYPLIPYVEVFGTVAENNPWLIREAVNKLESDPTRYTNRDLKRRRTRFLVTALKDIGLRGAIELAFSE